MSIDCGFGSLPLELIVKILQYLDDPCWAIRAGSTCKLLAAVAAADSIWKPLVLRDFPAVAKNFRGPAWDIRPGWEDFVALFGNLGLGEEEWDDTYFVTWKDAYVSEILYWKRGRRELGSAPRHWSTLSAIVRKTWREIFLEERSYMQLCLEEFPGRKKKPYDNWRDFYDGLNSSWGEEEESEDDCWGGETSDEGPDLCGDFDDTDEDEEEEEQEEEEEEQEEGDEEDS